MLKPAGRRECGRHGDSKDMGGAQGECSAGLPGRSRRRQPIGPAPWLESEASRKATRLLGRKFTSFLFPGQRIIPLSKSLGSAQEAAWCGRPHFAAAAAMALRSRVRSLLLSVAAAARLRGASEGAGDGASA